MSSLFLAENYCVLRKYRDKYKLVVIAGYNPNKSMTREDFASNDQKLENNLSRSRNKVFEYAYCNDWDYFVTMTLDKTKYDRYDLGAWKKDFSHWLRNYKRKTGSKIEYLFIPERHKDGAWHIHGLLSGLPEDRLSQFPKGTPLFGSSYLNWQDYADKYGFCSVGKVGNYEAVSKYITKYITKDMARLNNELNAHLYYCSQGLKTSEVLCQDMVYNSTGIELSPDFENKYVVVKWFDSYEDAMRVYLCDETLNLDDFEFVDVSGETVI